MFEGYWGSVAIFFGINVLMAFSLYVPMTAGLISLGQGGFMAIGAYASAVLTKDGVPFSIAVGVGGLLAALSGIAVGIPAIRIRGIYRPRAGKSTASSFARRARRRDEPVRSSRPNRRSAPDSARGSNGSARGTPHAVCNDAGGMDHGSRCRPGHRRWHTRSRTPRSGGHFRVYRH